MDLAGNCICGVDYRGQGTYTAEGIQAIADALRVNASLTSLDLSSNNLGGETDYIKASKVQGKSFNIGDEVIYEGRKMIVSKGKDRDGDIKMKPVDWVQGINAIADALRVNASLTKISLAKNQLGEEGTRSICEALKAKKTLLEDRKSVV